MAGRRDIHTRLMAASETVQQQSNNGNEIRCYTLPTHVQQVAPVQVGDPRKQYAQAAKKGIDGSPNITNDSNRITALEDLNRATLQRSTRAETQLIRDTTAKNSNN